MLKPFAYNCPGLSGPESRQDICRQTFGDFFKRRRRVVIPIFQRRYCWDPTRVNVWFDDVIAGNPQYVTKFLSQVKGFWSGLEGPGLYMGPLAYSRE